jgi:hypothetical protein
VLLVGHDGLSGAILDHALQGGGSSILCARLKERGIQFMIAQAPSPPSKPLCWCASSKQASDSRNVVAAMAALIREAKP